MSFEAMGRKPDGTLAGLPLTADGKLDTSASVEAPVGGATSAKQDEQTVYLDAIEGKLPALGQALAAASVPVVLPAAQITSLTAPVPWLDAEPRRASHFKLSGLARNRAAA